MGAVEEHVSKLQSLFAIHMFLAFKERDKANVIVSLYFILQLSISDSHGDVSHFIQNYYIIYCNFTPSKNLSRTNTSHLTGLTPRTANEFQICNNYSNIVKNNFKGGEGGYMAMT